MRNYFILDGVDSRNFGVYISGQGTFNASGRDYNIIPVPGRNGDLVGPEKRFANGTLTYPAFIYSNFKTNIEAFRNFLLSLVGYHDLVDSYHPDQIRKVLFQGPFNADVQTKNDAGRFDIEFICKPQRFLASGNEVTTFETTAETETFSGSIVTFDNPGGATVSALSTAINPVQDLHGYDSPWPAGGGKNLFDKDNANTLEAYINGSGVINSSGNDITAYIKIQKNQNFAVSFTQIALSTAPMFDDTQIGLYTSQPVLGLAGTRVYTNRRTSATEDFYFQYTGNSGESEWIAIKIGNITRTDITATMATLQIEYGATPTTYAPYSNICPISGFTEANIVVSPTQDAQDGTTCTVSFGAAGTVYGGTLDVVNGTLTVDRVAVDLSGITATASSDASLWRIESSQAMYPIDDAYKIGVCDKLVFESSYGTVNSTNGSIGFARTNGTLIIARIDSITTASDIMDFVKGLQVVYPLATPQTYTLTPTEVQLLLGTNNVWSDTGDVTATIAFPQSQFTITNPTLFDSQPFLRVYGTGTLGIGSQSVTITQADGYTDIDCEMMDCFKGTANKNPYVQFTDYNFPVFKPGVNYVSLSGIIKVEITPRWWIV